jgi:Sec-independent protein translocase protein TatA
VIGPVEILIVFLALLLVGPRRIQNLLRSMGRGAHDFVEQLGRDKKPDDKQLPGEEDPEKKK